MTFNVEVETAASVSREVYRTTKLTSILLILTLSGSFFMNLKNLTFSNTELVSKTNNKTMKIKELGLCTSLFTLVMTERWKVLQKKLKE